MDRNNKISRLLEKFELLGEEEKVILDGALYQNELEEEDVLELKTWVASGDSLGDFGPVRCFLWCGEDQEVPETDALPAEAKVMEDLVKIPKK